jgi:hypothetical protein
MEKVLTVLNALLPVLSGIGGAFIGGYFTRKSQHDLLSREIAREDTREMRKELRETLDIYSKVLEIDGEILFTVLIGGSHTEFEIDKYQEKIRPVLYGKFYLIHNDVAKIVSSMDSLIQECNFNEEITSYEHKVLCQEYWKLIRIINEHMQKFRNDMPNSSPK